MTTRRSASNVKVLHSGYTVMMFVYKSVFGNSVQPYWFLLRAAGSRVLQAARFLMVFVELF